MSHQPPVPQANQSPYPIAEPPHRDHDDVVDDRAAGATDHATVRDSSLPSLLPFGALAAGAAAIGGVIYWLSNRRPAKRRATA